MVQRPIGVPDLAPGAGVAEYRTRERTVPGDGTVVEQYLINGGERVVLGKFMATTFRTTGVAVANWNIASLFNRVGSGVLVAVERMSVQIDYPSNTTGVRTTRASRITTNPTTGTLLSQTSFDTSGSHASLVEFRGATASDGGAAVTLTATPGSPAWGQFFDRNASATVFEQRLIPDNSIIPGLADKEPVILSEGQGLLVTGVDAPSTSAFYLVNVVWEEFTLP